MEPQTPKIYQRMDLSGANSAVGGGHPFEVAKAQVNALLQAVPNLSDCDRILDYGCGIGRTMPALFERLNRHGLQLDGCDISKSFIDEARVLHRESMFNFFKIAGLNDHYLKFELSEDSEEIPASSYDAAYSFSVFTHLTLEMASNTLKFLENVLAHDGLYYFTLFRLDPESVALINAGGNEGSFRFEVPVSDDANEYFAIPHDPLAFAALGHQAIEESIQLSGFKVEDFIPGAWRGMPAANIHDAYVIRKL